MLKRIFRRNRKRIMAAGRHFPRVLANIWGLRHFRHSLALAGCYLSRTCPKGLCVETRRGGRIQLTGDEDDLVTVLVVMGRQDYGSIPMGGVVFDVGAHLGAFTLHAIWQGARKVYAFEPDPKLFATLLQNVRNNGLDKQVEASRHAVVGSGPDEVVYYAEGNASGHIGQPGEQAGGLLVPAHSLAAILGDPRIPVVDLLKLDCEGSEYGIIFDTPDPVWERIAAIRLEFHKGRAEEIGARLQRLGFQLVKRVKGVDDGIGLMWFDRPPVPIRAQMC